MDWIDEIKARADAATLGPWAWSDGYENILYTCANDKRPVAYGWSDGYGGSGIDINNDDAVFIAASRIDIPRLIHEVEQLRLKLVERQGIAMKDNHPNYLNYHGIDPSRIDQAPGFDSIRPGQTSKRYGAPEISLTPDAERMRQERRTFAAQLRDLMELSGMDNDTLAAATGIKVSKILSYRTSNALPKVMDAVRLARALGVSVELLMTVSVPSAGSCSNERYTAIQINYCPMCGRNMREAIA